MKSFGSNQRRGQSRQKTPYHGQSRPKQRLHGSGRRVSSADEKKFLAGTAVDPHPRIILEKGSDDLSVRALDLICPIGMGQRALVVASPGLGKTTFLKNICHAVTNGYPQMKVSCVLIDERPEEVTDFTRSVNAKVYSSSIDHSHENHIKIVDTVISEAFKDAAAGHNVMILLD